MKLYEATHMGSSVLAIERGGRYYLSTDFGRYDPWRIDPPRNTKAAVEFGYFGHGLTEIDDIELGAVVWEIDD